MNAEGKRVIGPLRGVILILFGVLALYRGLATLHTGHRAWLLAALGLASFALGVWHILRQRR